MRNRAEASLNPGGHQQTVTRRVWRGKWCDRADKDVSRRFCAGPGPCSFAQPSTTGQALRFFTHRSREAALDAIRRTHTQYRDPRRLFDFHNWPNKLVAAQGDPSRALYNHLFVSLHDPPCQHTCMRCTILCPRRMMKLAFGRESR